MGRTSSRWRSPVSPMPAPSGAQICIATSSIGPGATNMVTAAGVAMANRLPLLIISGDTCKIVAPTRYSSEEQFGEPSLTVNDCFKPVVRFWDRVTHPEQLLALLPQRYRRCWIRRRAARLSGAAAGYTGPGRTSTAFLRRKSGRFVGIVPTVPSFLKQQAASGGERR